MKKLSLCIKIGILGMLLYAGHLIPYAKKIVKISTVLVKKGAC